MSVILFYSPFDQRSRDTESLMIAFKKQGHRVISLSQASGTQIHDYLRQHNIETYTHVIDGDRNSLHYFKHVKFLIRFIKKHKVDVVYSHLEPANLAASIAQYFVRAKVYLVRHHINEAKLQGFDRSYTYRLTYRLAKRIIVVSAHAKKFMIEVEKVDPQKIIHINLAYDFNIYNKPDPTKVKEYKAGFDDYITLVTVGRFSHTKRTSLVIEVLKNLRQKGVKARLIIAGKGDEEQSLKKLIHDEKLSDFVSMPGYVNNVLDYLAASDFLLHPSLSESSCVTVKEAALVGLPVIVCKGVGDFDDYMENEKNGFVVQSEEFVERATEIIYANKRKDLSAITSSLYKKVFELFDVRNVVGNYQKLNEA